MDKEKKARVKLIELISQLLGKEGYIMTTESFDELYELETDQLVDIKYQLERDIDNHAIAQ